MSLSRITLLFCLVASLVATAAGQSGTIFITDHHGNLKTGNLFKKTDQVYLNASDGPFSTCTGGGFANGDYYFQVTTPAGDVLLSTDGIANRIVTIFSGHIVSTSAHQTKSGNCPGEVRVQLTPYTLSPNNGGEHKVWFTPVGSYDATASTGFFGFQSTDSLTQNFKVKGGQPVAQTIITGREFYDLNENSVFEPLSGEFGMPGWRIELYQNGVFDGVTFTDSEGNYEFIRDDDGSTYDVFSVAPPPGYIPAIGGVFLAITSTQGSVVATGPAAIAPDFGVLLFSVPDLVDGKGPGRSPGFWHNEGESLLAASDPTWRYALNGGLDPLSGRLFPAPCLRNPVETFDPLVSIFLVPQEPADFQTVAFPALASYLTGNAALGHIGFVLSRQVGAVILNNTCGFMQGTVYIDRFDTGELVSLESMLTGVFGLLCDPNAGDTGPNTQHPALRQMMINCLNEFEDINKTEEPGEPQVVFTMASDPEKVFGEYSSPY